MAERSDCAGDVYYGGIYANNALQPAPALQLAQRLLPQKQNCGQKVSEGGFTGGELLL